MDLFVARLIEYSSKTDSALENSDNDQWKIGWSNDVVREKEAERKPTHSKPHCSAEKLGKRFFLKKVFCLLRGSVYERKYCCLKGECEHACSKLQHRGLHDEIFDTDVCSAEDVDADENERRYEADECREKTVRAFCHHHDFDGRKENDREPGQAKDPSAVILMIDGQREPDDHRRPDDESDIQGGLELVE